MRRWIIILAAIFLVGGVPLLWPWGNLLLLSPAAGGPPLMSLPLGPDERFTLHYIHSVDKEPIWEEHSVDGEGSIYVEEERFVMVGAGMGDLPGRGRHGGRDGLQVISNLHYRLGGFILRVGSPGVDHTILWRGKALNLSRNYAGQALSVEARPIRLGEYLWKSAQLAVMGVENEPGRDR